MINVNATEIDSISPSGIKYSICTLVSKPSEYEEMLASFINAGFETSFCEYLYIDNSKQNKYEAFGGINQFILKAKGTFIIICHQDILLRYDKMDMLEKRIKEITSLDPSWAVLSNAGAVGIKNIVYRITGNDGKLESRGVIPQKVNSVDENFIVIRRSANLALSRDLSGFHLYGTELCIIANSLGFSCYVVDFNLLHKSDGNADQSFYHIKNMMIEKYTAAWKGRYIQTTMTNFYLSGNTWRNWFFSTQLVRFFARQYFKRKYKHCLLPSPLDHDD